MNLRWVPVPTARLAIVAALLAVVVAVFPGDSTTGLVVVNVALLVAAVVDWWLAPRLAGEGAIEVRRSAPAVVALDDTAELAWTVDNPLGRTLRLSFADQLAPSLRASRRRIALQVPGGARATATATIRPSRRGRFEVAEMAVRVEGPLGLAARQDRQVRRHLLRVYPSFGSRDEAELRINRARILEVGLRSAQGRGGGTEFDAMREYGPDDEFRRIDWPSTARAGKPIVRTYRAERNQTVLLLLDTGRTMAGRVGASMAGRVGGSMAGRVGASMAGRVGASMAGRVGGSMAGRVGEVPRLEHAMDAVMMLTAVATRLGDRAGLVAFDRDVRAVVPPGHSRGQLSRVTEALYELEPQLVESDYEGAFVTTLARFRKRALLVVFTELSEQAVAETLLPALPLVARDHVVVVASVQDPVVVELATSSPDEPSEVYAKASAVAALEERRRLVARLRGMGVTVVDAPPGKLAPALADAYLRVKATGRL